MYIRLMKLSKVLSLNVGKDVAILLRDYIEKHQELVSAKVYLALASGFDRPQSIEYAEKALRLCQEQDDMQGQINAYRKLGEIYYDAIWMGKEAQYEELAKEVFVKAKELSVEYYGELHPVVMHCYEDLSMMSDDLDEAMAYAQKALSLGRAIFGDNHPLVGRPYHYVGVIYREKAEWENALRYFQKSCQIWLPAYGINHELMVASYNNQGKALRNLGRYEEAFECYDKCLAIQNVISDRIGCDHVIHHINKARVLLLLGRMQAAYDECMAAKAILDDEKVKTEPRSKDLRVELEELVKMIEP